LIQDGRIEWVGPAQEACPALVQDVEVLEAPDLTALPGLIDSHVHLTFSAGPFATRDINEDSDQACLLWGMRNAQEALGAGLTTVRDCGGRGRLTLALRKERGRIFQGPRILACAMPITTTGGHLHYLGLTADGETELREAVWELGEMGADFIKVCATGGAMTPGSDKMRAQYSAAELRAVVEEAHRMGMRVSAHCLGLEGCRNAAEAGVDTLDHLTFETLEGSRYDPDVVEMIAAKGLFVSPTLATGHRAREAGADVVTELTGSTRRLTREDKIANCKRMLDAGVRLLPGSDSGVVMTRAGDFALGLEMFVRDLGITPMEAIVAATRWSAEALDVAGEVGTLTRGKRADIVLVEGDPPREIGDLRRVRWVYQGGDLVWAGTGLEKRGAVC